MSDIPLLVLTGGTVAGKSTVLALLAAALAEQAVFIEETGTKVLARPDFQPPTGRRDGEQWEEWQLGLQKQIFKEQRQAEKEALDRAAREEKQLVVTDRGTPDCWIWLSDPTARRFEENTGTTIEAEFCRYSKTIYLPSISVVSEELYLQYRQSNPSRLPRSWESAKEVEARTRLVWSNCDRVSWIQGELSVEEKFRVVKQVCDGFLQIFSHKPQTAPYRLPPGSKLEC